MAKQNLRSPNAKSPLYRHRRRSDAVEIAAYDKPTIEAIEHHYDRYLGHCDSVFHEFDSEYVHLDVHLIPPTEDRNYYTLATTGMSSRPMQVPEKLTHRRYAELMIHLPADWNLPVIGSTSVDWQHERYYWVIRAIKFAARMPHEYATWLGPLHTISNGDPPEPFDESAPFYGVMLLNPFCLPEEAWTLSVGDKIINFYLLVPVYSEEMKYKIEHGGDALIDRLIENKLNCVLDTQRRNSCQTI